MKRPRPLLPTIILLIAAMIFGFAVLSRISGASLPVMVMVGLVVVVISLLLLWFAVVFDRQMRQKRNGNEESDQT